MICRKENNLGKFYSIYRTAPTTFTAKPYNSQRLEHSIWGYLHLSESHALLDLCNGESRVEALGASPAAVQDSVAAVQAHAVVEAVHALGGLLVTRVGDPAVRLHEHGGAEVLLAVPPV